MSSRGGGELPDESAYHPLPRNLSIELASVQPHTSIPDKFLLAPPPPIYQPVLQPCLSPSSTAFSSHCTWPKYLGGKILSSTPLAKMMKKIIFASHQLRVFAYARRACARTSVYEHVLARASTCYARKGSNLSYRPTPKISPNPATTRDLTDDAAPAKASGRPKGSINKTMM